MNLQTEGVVATNRTDRPQPIPWLSSVGGPGAIDRHCDNEHMRGETIRKVLADARRYFAV
jgi:hypothetical protein